MAGTPVVHQLAARQRRRVIDARWRFKQVTRWNSERIARQVVCCARFAECAQ